MRNAAYITMPHSMILLENTPNHLAGTPNIIVHPTHGSTDVIPANNNISYDMSFTYDGNGMYAINVTEHTTNIIMSMYLETAKTPPILSNPFYDTV